MSTVLTVYLSVYAAGFLLTAVVLACAAQASKEDVRRRLKKKIEDCYETVTNASDFSDAAKDKVKQQTLSWTEGGKFIFILLLLITLQSLLWPLLLLQVLAMLSSRRY